MRNDLEKASMIKKMGLFIRTLTGIKNNKELVQKQSKFGKDNNIPFHGNIERSTYDKMIKFKNDQRIIKSDTYLLLYERFLLYIEKLIELKVPCQIELCQYKNYLKDEIKNLVNKESQSQSKIEAIDQYLNKPVLAESSYKPARIVIEINGNVRTKRIGDYSETTIDRPVSIFEKMESNRRLTEAIEAMYRPLRIANEMFRFQKTIEEIGKSSLRKTIEEIERNSVRRVI